MLIAPSNNRKCDIMNLINSKEAKIAPIKPSFFNRLLKSNLVKIYNKSTDMSSNGTENCNLYPIYYMFFCD